MRNTNASWMTYSETTIGGYSHGFGLIDALSGYFAS
jgi:hypothetical protein